MCKGKVVAAATALKALRAFSSSVVCCGGMHVCAERFGLSGPWAVRQSLRQQKAREAAAII